MVVRPAVVTALAALLLAAWPVAAQDAADQPPTPRRVLIAVEKDRWAGFSNDDLGILERSFLTTWSGTEGAPSALAFGSGQFPAKPADREKAARTRGADAWLLLVIAGSPSHPTLNVSSWDLLYQVAPVSLTARRRDPFPMMDIDRELWGDIIPRVVAAWPPIPVTAYNRGTIAAVPVVVRALPGTVVSGLTPKPVVVGRDGTAALQIPSPSPYSYRATLGGYVPEAQSLYYNGEAEIVIHQTRSPWLLLDLALLDGFYPGVSGTFAASPFPGFLRLGFTTFRAGIAVSQDSGILSSLPLSQLSLHAGLYLSPEDRAVRWYAGVGGLLRVSLPPGGTITLYGFMPWGVQGIGGLEITFDPHLRTFIELAPSYYATPLSGLFLAYYADSGFPYIPLGTSGALDPVELRVGVRWVP